MSTADGRYDRQVILSSWDRRAQNELGNSDVAVVGCGALGTHTVEYLARAGVGSISIVDRDYIELTNLQRTTLFSESDLGRSKALVAREKIGEINSEVEVEVLSTDLNPANARKILGGHDLILDCTDNLLTRYLINDFSVRYSIPWIYAAVIESQGMTMNIVPDEGPCFRCLFPERPPPGALPTCDTVGVMNTIPPVISSVQVTEAVKYLTQMGFEAGNLLTFDIWTRDFSTVKIEKSDNCPCCGGEEFEFLNSEVRQTTTSVCGREAVQINPHMEEEMNLEELGRNLRSVENLKIGSVLLRFESDGYKMTVFKDGRAIIEGTEDESVARSIYSRYIGN